jgi:heme exporter protein A
MSDASVAIEGVGRVFGRRRVLSGVNAEIGFGRTLVVTGANGSGKSTLLRIVAGVLAPTEGRVRVTVGGRQLDRAGLRSEIGYAAPDLVLYADLTAVENLCFFAALRGMRLDTPALRALLSRVGLLGRGRDLVSSYSSGMRQRLKIAFALLHDPTVLLLDEPTANLDAEGAAMARQVVEDHKARGIVIVATNEPEEAAWADRLVRLGESDGDGA